MNEKPTLINHCLNISPYEHTADTKQIPLCLWPSASCSVANLVTFSLFTNFSDPVSDISSKKVTTGTRKATLSDHQRKTLEIYCNSSPCMLFRKMQSTGVLSTALGSLSFLLCHLAVRRCGVCGKKKDATCQRSGSLVVLSFYGYIHVLTLKILQVP